MGDAVNTLWLLPPNWDETPRAPGEKYTGPARIRVKFTNLSDGTGESKVKKLDASNLRTPSGEICTKIIIDKIEYNVSGMNVLLEWDRTSDAEICRLLALNGTVSGVINGPLVDPSAASEATGDVILTTTGHTAGDGYEIILHARLI